MRKKEDQNAAAEDRRRYIWDAVNANRDKPLAFSTVHEQFGNLSEQTLHNDARLFRREGKPVSIAAKAFIYDLIYSDTLAARRRRRPGIKREIGRLAAKIIVNGNPDEVHSETTLSESLTRKLDALCRKTHRLVALDAGSTSEHVANALNKYRTPLRHLSSLRILTNSAAVSHIIQSDDLSQHGVVMIGGNLRGDTDATCGVLAERCFDAMGVSPDIAVIGASSMGKDYTFSCNHEDEAAIKTRLLDASAIRVIAIDSSKLLKQTRSASWNIARIDGNIDAVITDEGRRLTQDREDLKANFDSFVDACITSQVAVFFTSARGDE
ncbi:MAG: hypothetical protein AAGB04_20940 [Pseudomonadota bacterium]